MTFLMQSWGYEKSNRRNYLTLNSHLFSMGPIVLIQANQLILIIICRPKGAALVALYAVPSASGTSMPIKPEARK